ncbi:MAG TPA: DUF3160 domain-containing protein [Candidatus Latescibacteria bacterium]|nr:DUF3160 domain-containing protein [Candidatus Latescibacterota bacterium]
MTKPVSREPLFLFAAAILLSVVSFSTALADIDLEAHRQFLIENRALSSADLVSEFGSDVFLPAATTVFTAAAFADSIDHYYSLTGYEKLLLDRRGFVVTERVRSRSFGAAYMEIYKRDLPLFVSTDAILHALHKSYDTVLADLESAHLRTQLETALKRMHRALYLAGVGGDYPGEAIALATVERPTQVGDSRVGDDSQEGVGALAATSHANPFNASTLIRFSVDAQSAGSHVDLVVYNAEGQRVRVLLSRALDAGHFSVRRDGLTESREAVASGQHIYRLVGEQRASGKISLVR